MLTKIRKKDLPEKAVKLPVAVTHEDIQSAADRVIENLKDSGSDINLDAVTKHLAEEIDRMRAIIQEALKSDEPLSFEFNVTRNSHGLIEKVIATPYVEEEAAYKPPAEVRIYGGEH